MSKVYVVEESCGLGFYDADYSIACIFQSKRDAVLYCLSLGGEPSDTSDFFDVKYSATDLLGLLISEHELL